MTCEGNEGNLSAMIPRISRKPIRVGTLIRHEEDAVFGVVIDNYKAKGPALARTNIFLLFWFDHDGAQERSEEWVREVCTIY